MHSFYLEIKDNSNPDFFAREVISLPFPSLKNDEDVANNEEYKAFDYWTYIDDVTSAAKRHIFNNGYQSSYYTIEEIMPIECAKEFLEKRIKSDEDFIKTLDIYIKL